MIERLPNFVGLKEASNNWEYFIEAQRTTSELRPDFGMLVGVEYVLPSMVLGGRRVFVRLRRGGTRPDRPALCLPARVRPIAKRINCKRVASQLWTLFKVNYPARIKAAMAILGRPVGQTRLPIRPLDAEAERWLEKQLAELGILESELHGWNAVPEKSAASRASRKT